MDGHLQPGPALAQLVPNARLDPTSSDKDFALIFMAGSVALSFTSISASLVSAALYFTASTLLIRLPHLVSDQDFKVVVT